MFNKLSYRFSDSNNPSLGFMLKFIKLFGLWPSDRSLLKTIFIKITFVYAIVYFLNVFVYLFVRRDYHTFIVFIQNSAFFLGILKCYNFLRWHNTWKRIVELISTIELEMNEEHLKHTTITLKYRKYCYLIPLVFIVGCFVMNIAFVLVFWMIATILPHVRQEEVNNINLFISWLPFDDSTRSGRYFSVLLQTFFSEITCGYIMNWDPCVLTIMLFFAGQLKALRTRCAHALDEDEELCLKNIVKCHQHYLTVVECQQLFNSVVSPVMFAYFMMIILNFGVCITLVAMNKDNIQDLIPAIQLVVGLSFQLTFFYWIANETIVESLNLGYGTFESQWVEGTVRVRRAVLMLGIGMRRRIVYTAGPFNEMSLSTLISILRTSYSFYTILSRN